MCIIISANAEFFPLRKNTLYFLQFFLQFSLTENKNSCCERKWENILSFCENLFVEFVRKFSFSIYATLSFRCCESRVLNKVNFFLYFVRAMWEKKKNILYKSWVQIQFSWIFRSIKFDVILRAVFCLNFLDSFFVFISEFIFRK